MLLFQNMKHLNQHTHETNTHDDDTDDDDDVLFIIFKLHYILGEKRLNNSHFPQITL